MALELTTANAQARRERRERPVYRGVRPQDGPEMRDHRALLLEHPGLEDVVVDGASGPGRQLERRRAEVAADGAPAQLLRREGEVDTERAADLLFRHFKRRPFDHLIVGANNEALRPALTGETHAYLAERIRGWVDIDEKRASESEVFEAVREVMDAHSSRRSGRCSSALRPRRRPTDARQRGSSRSSRRWPKGGWKRS